jgi:predicted enzyme related to lactoylglutathione lyase
MHIKRTMKKYLSHITLLSGLCVFACTSQNKPDEQQNLKSGTKTESHMNHLISIVEIPTTDFTRAVNFYQAILSVSVQEVNMGEVQMGILSGNDENLSVALLKGDDYKPAANGVIVYLNAGKDLQPALDKVEPNGGKILVPKTIISPEMGYFALFLDSEGNKVGLHSSN